MRNYGDNWKKDKLNRIEDAKYLTKYLIAKYKKENNNLNNDSFVLNINAEWGFGKTYFLENWADDLDKIEHPVVYFDAWENDFSKEPLLALISTINEQLTPYFNESGSKKALKDWFKVGKKLIKPSVPFLLSILVKKAIGISADELSDLYNEQDDGSSSIENNNVGSSSESKSDELGTIVSTLVSKSAEKNLDTHNSTRKTITQFKDNLKILTGNIKNEDRNELPIFIFIDELDRCRPNYSIEILENIKHLFGVPGVFFVIATASEQLSHSIQAVYGNNFDGCNYLKRFFDQTYTLNEPNRYLYSAYLFSKYKLNDRENLYSPLNEISAITDGGSLVDAFGWISSLFEIGLRDMEQYCIVIDSISLTFKKEKIHIMYLVFLMALKHKYPDIYVGFKNGVGVELRDLSLNPDEYKRRIFTDNFNSRIEIGFHQIINKYFGFLRINLFALDEQGRAESRLIENIRMVLIENWSYNNRTDTHYLLKYPALIEQAGNLTILTNEHEN